MSQPTRIRRGTSEYPQALETIADPPDQIWVLGVLSTEASVAIVGTRRATRYGLGLAREMGRAVASTGWPVVSGLARGIDGAAHRGCLEVGGVGIAVLGSGVDVWYPPEHRELGQALVAGGGAVLSEYPPGTRPEPWRFPARNRIISGLAAAVVVVEAAEKGGALITARLGAEQGREVFAVPGDLSRATSVGSNRLIRDGAHPVLGTDELIEALTFVMGPPPRPSDPTQPVLELEIPVGGASLEAVVEANGGDPGQVLALLGRLEAAGDIRIEAGDVFPSS